MEPEMEKVSGRSQRSMRMLVLATCEKLQLIAVQSSTTVHSSDRLLRLQVLSALAGWWRRRRMKVAKKKMVEDVEDVEAKKGMVVFDGKTEE